MKSDEKRRLTDDEYKFIFSRVPRFCLDFIIVKNNEILLAKRNIEPFKGYWSLPGGVLRYKESFDEGSERILKSELGVKPLEKKLIGFIEFSDEVNKNGIHIHSVSLVFLIKVKDEKNFGSSKAHEVDFFESLPRDVHPVQGKFLEENWRSFIK